MRLLHYRVLSRRGDSSSERTCRIDCCRQHWATILPPLPQKLKIFGDPIEGVLIAVIPTKKRPPKGCLFGREEATRTPDPHVPNVVRYQLRYFSSQQMCEDVTFFGSISKNAYHFLRVKRFLVLAGSDELIKARHSSSVNVCTLVDLGMRKLPFEVLIYAP